MIKALCLLLARIRAVILVIALLHDKTGKTGGLFVGAQVHYELLQLDLLDVSHVERSGNPNT